MGQRAEREIDVREINLFDFLQRRQGHMPQVREDIAHRHTRFAIPRKGHDFHRRMGRDQAHQLCARIARGPQNCDFLAHMRAPQADSKVIGRFKNCVACLETAAADPVVRYFDTVPAPINSGRRVR